MAEHLEEQLWRLEIPLVGNPLKTLNSYLLTGGQRSLLIDTGFDQAPCWEAMDAQLRQIGVDRSRMDIFLTHLHSDHTGLVPGYTSARSTVPC
nr:MBL fold metallo-hydrolase [uncultured Dysosmobacter sp.]